MVIETVLGVPYAEAVQREIAEPLGLTRTRVFTDPTDTSPLPLRHGDRSLSIPRRWRASAPTAASSRPPAS
jgi:CubicO group peptidase (beta-lactamase class C family)